MLSNVSINHEVIPVTDMFRNILGACNTTVRLNDTNAIGAGSHEAEAAISYVPFRNQFLLTLAAAKAEQLYPNEKVIFILGANLSEGMIYLDNSEPFITSMNQVVKVGGQSCLNFEVVAPFVNRTKTDMVKYAIKHHYDLSTVYSCYFPKEDGQPCGECGSCLLHDNALARSK
jgi:7-cyano-7-deazaguanine synthase